MAQLISTSFLDQLMLATAIDPSVTPPATALSTCKLRLITNSPSENKTLTWADMTEATFSGYAASATVVWNTPILEDDGSYTTTCPSKQWVSEEDDPQVFEDITGIAITDGGGSPNLLAFCVFDEPVSLTAVGQGLDVIVAINQGAISVNSEAIVVR